MFTQQKKIHSLLLLLVTTASCALLTGCPDQNSTDINAWTNSAADTLFSACKGDQSKFDANAVTLCKNLTKQP